MGEAVCIAVIMELDMLKIEQVVVGEEVSSTETIKPEPVITPSLQPYQHDSLQCFQCFITFCNSKAKERHMRKSHREEYKQQLQQTDTLFTCYVCDRTFPSSEELTQHQASHSQEDKPFRCPYCQGSFRTFSELTVHRRNLCTERQCICKDCNMVFRGPAQLRTHRLSLHPQPIEEADDETMTHRCGKCGRGFKTEEELVQHQEDFAGDQHCNAKPQAKRRGRPPKKAGEATLTEGDTATEEKCGEADEGGVLDEASREPLTKGGKRKGRPPKMLSQQEELKIPCPEADCDLTFSSLSLFRAHKKEKHAKPPPPRKAYPCTECEESYARSEQLKAHMARAHGSGRHNCSTCGKSFGRESNLKAHQKTHTEGEEATDKGKR